MPRKHVDVETVGKRLRACCCVGPVNICTGSGKLAEVEDYGVRDKRLGFDLLSGIDAVTPSGGINITQK